MKKIASNLDSTKQIPTADRARIRRRLLAWYDRNRRDLPWRRRAADPYAQWVAEAMLQQTRVDTVLNYYERFLKRFPDVPALARASREVVLKHWEGLGYYRRVVHLHEAAKQLAADGAAIPNSSHELRRLPGVGPYLAAAIASIAFGERAAAVDGNVARVISRLMGVTDDVQSGPGRRTIQSLADQLIPPGRPGDFNQAWMDLGSAVCTSRSPDCDACPLSGECVALATGMTDELPVLPA
ncbi:MAG: A/G-specific adenine glycosylase, partial [Planctomycetes bacterium]|nr:A/G-specific adenine glycosylase [Planctomycetota bacterium]